MQKRPLFKFVVKAPAWEQMAKTTPGKLQRSDELAVLSPNVVKLSSIISTLLYTDRENVQRFPKHRFSTGREKIRHIMKKTHHPGHPCPYLSYLEKRPFFKWDTQKRAFLLGFFVECPGCPTCPTKKRYSGQRRFLRRCFCTRSTILSVIATTFFQFPAIVFFSRTRVARERKHAKKPIKRPFLPPAHLKKA